MTDSPAKKFVSALSESGDWHDALDDVSRKIRSGLAGSPCDLAVFFVSEKYANFIPSEFAAELRRRTGARTLIGCNASGVIGDLAEIEMEPGVTVLAMSLPGVRLVPFAMTAGELQNRSAGVSLIEDFDFYPTEKPRFLCLADPMTCDIEKLLGLFNSAYPNCPVIGGLASGAIMQAPNWIALDEEIFSEGAAGVAMLGEIEFEMAVAQGCRPIGKPLVVTKADGNVLEELAGRPAFVVLKEIMSTLPPKDQALARHSLFVGLAMPSRLKFDRGDFLVRNITGLDPSSGSLMIGAHLKAGQTLQFQLRDAETSSEDLKARLEALGEAGGTRAGILVTCCGRGKGLYSEPNHDILAVQTLRGPMPVAGFFANGEIGPVGGKNYVHGYTTSLAILR